jgi:hypothetical protein
VQYTVQETTVLPPGVQLTYGNACDLDGLVTANGEDLQCDVINTGSVLLQVTKECLGEFAQTNFLIRVREPGGLTIGGLNGPCGATGTPFPVYADTLYQVTETNAGGDVDDVRYRGACDGDGTITPTTEQVEAGTTLTCVVTNVNLVTLTVIKDCEPDDLAGGPFLIELHRESVDGTNNLETTFSLECGASDTFQIDDTVEYILREINPPAGVEVTFGDDGGGEFCSNVGDYDGRVVALGGNTQCTVTNTLLLPEGFAKYTLGEPEEPGQFSWYIQVPAGWPFFLLDFMPQGVTIVEVIEPAGVNCNTFLGYGLACWGNGDEDATIEVIVSVDECGDYTNTAKLFRPFAFPQFATDTANVCQVVEDGEVTTASQGALPLFGASWWDRLWSIFGR